MIVEITKLIKFRHKWQVVRFLRWQDGKVNRNAWKKQRKPFRSALLFCVCYISVVVHADRTVRCDSELKLVVDFRAFAVGLHLFFPDLLHIYFQYRLIAFIARFV